MLSFIGRARSRASATVRLRVFVTGLRDSAQVLERWIGGEDQRGSMMGSLGERVLGCVLAAIEDIRNRLDEGPGFSPVGAYDTGGSSEVRGVCAAEIGLDYYCAEGASGHWSRDFYVVHPDDSSLRALLCLGEDFLFGNAVIIDRACSVQGILVCAYAPILRLARGKIGVGKLDCEGVILILDGIQLAEYTGVRLWHFDASNSHSITVARQALSEFIAGGYERKRYWDVLDGDERAVGRILHVNGSCHFRSSTIFANPRSVGRDLCRIHVRHEKIFVRSSVCLVVRNICPLLPCFGIL
jgi:hypothetical protein